MTTNESVMEFEVLIEPDEDGFHVWCPALKGCHSFGLTREEARENIKDAIDLWLSDGDRVNIPERARVQVTVA